MSLVIKLLSEKASLAKVLVIINVMSESVDNLFSTDLNLSLEQIFMEQSSISLQD